ncbi:hypothetical protein EST38_g2990 [Candolleomyces aberdarensis]|uniref:Bicarbonate transporter-like transmembrane domain-containing protein n=1 Tax=Candolleomyces aberdarensis TaxID=2316362 RepID=A0A4V1Q4Q2_9AGAR|nr:hypothetical protein EST38_g2990 [Candolleomyces aberdarensis]
MASEKASEIAEISTATRHSTTGDELAKRSKKEQGSPEPRITGSGQRLAEKVTKTPRLTSWPKRLGRGIIHDIRARTPYYWSDWKDAWNYRVVPATALIFFANVLPGIAFSLDLIETTHLYGVSEVLLSSFMAAFIFSVFGAQPLTIAGVTGPITVFNKTIYHILEREDSPPNYLHFIGWVYLWAAIFHWVTAILNWCDFLKYVTLFSCDTFGFYVAWVYLQYGIQVLTRQFPSDPSSESEQGAIVGILLALLMFGTSFVFNIFARSPLFHRHVRRFLADYGMPISLIASSAMAYWGRFNFADPSTLPTGRAFQPAADREWLVRFWQLEGKWVGIALPFGVILWILFFFDHNVSSLMAQGIEFPLRKPPGFHYDFFLLGVTTFIAGLLGLPAPNGLIPQAPIHTQSLVIMGREPKSAEDEEAVTPISRSQTVTGVETNNSSRMSEEQPPVDPTIFDRHEVPVAVVEQRVSNLAQGSLCLVLLTGPFLHILNLIPKGVLAGLFWYMGVDALLANGMSHKIKYLLQDKHLTSRREPLRKVRKSRIWLFLAIQLIGFGATFAITQTIAAIGFPVIIMLLLPVRILLIPRLPFTSEELSILDGPAASPFSNSCRMSTDSSKLLGVVLLARHGDREGFYQDPNTYTPANTAITPLGSQQEYQLGQYLRSVYLNTSSPSYIPGFDADVANGAQFKIRADAGGEGGVIFNSVLSMLQGLFPPTTQYNTTLANGTTIVGPLTGYQSIPIESVESEEDISLEGWVECTTFSNNTQAFFKSEAFAQKSSETAAFREELHPYLGERSSSLENMWNVFDFMNVQSIHNATFAASLPDGYLAQARDLANWHQFNIFSSSDLSSVGNIAGRTISAPILDAIASIVDGKDTTKLVFQGISYKPFLSLFKMTGVTELNPQLAGIVNYAASIAYEVREPAGGGEPTIRFLFKNGTDDAAFTRYGFLGSSSNDVPLSTFINTLAPNAVNDTATWCSICNNHEDRGCAALTQARTQGIESVNLPEIGSVGAGFLGTGLTFALSLAIVGALLLFGCVRWDKKRSSKNAGGKLSSPDNSVHDVESQETKF